jgi:hypothetical protein
MFLWKPLSKSGAAAIYARAHISISETLTVILTCAITLFKINVSELFGGQRQEDKNKKNKMGHIICRSTNRDKIVRLFAGVWRDYTQIFSRTKGH